jgi:hypothetical protein
MHRRTSRLHEMTADGIRTRGESGVRNDESYQRFLLAEGKSEQARTEKRETGCGQRQEAVGDKVMIPHDAPSDSILVRSP